MTLQQGSLLAYPTETVFGLGGDPWNAQVWSVLWQLKGRPADRTAGILLIPDPGWLDRLAMPLSGHGRRLVERYWPGPLTLVLPARSGVTPPVASVDGSVAVRWSPAPTVQALMQLWQRPLISTSANRSGAPPARCADDLVQAGLGDVPTLRERAGDLAWQQPSTIVRLEGERVTVLRPGAVDVTEMVEMAGGGER